MSVCERFQQILWRFYDSRWHTKHSVGVNGLDDWDITVSDGIGILERFRYRRLI